MSQMTDFCPNNSIPLIFYVTNHFDIHLILIKQSQEIELFGKSKLSSILQKKWKIKNLVSLHYFVEHYEGRKKGAYLKWKMKYNSLKMPLCHFFGPFLRKLQY